MSSPNRSRIVAGDNDPRHGTANGYSNLRCRCDLCREAWRVYFKDYLHRSGRRRPMATYLAERFPNGPQHGRASTYNAGCRCDDCRRVASARRQHARLRARGAA